MVLPIYDLDFIPDRVEFAFPSKNKMFELHF